MSTHHASGCDGHVPHRVLAIVSKTWGLHSRNLQSDLQSIRRKIFFLQNKSLIIYWNNLFDSFGALSVKPCVFFIYNAEQVCVIIMNATRESESRPDTTNNEPVEDEQWQCFSVDVLCHDHERLLRFVGQLEGWHQGLHVRDLLLAEQHVRVLVLDFCS